MVSGSGNPYGPSPSHHQGGRAEHVGRPGPVPDGHSVGGVEQPQHPGRSTAPYDQLLNLVRQQENEIHLLRMNVTDKDVQIGKVGIN